MGVGAGLYMYDVVVKKFTFAISSPDEFLFLYVKLCYWLTIIIVCSMRCHAIVARPLYIGMCYKLIDMNFNQPYRLM